jgi:hypothetical protein
MPSVALQTWLTTRVAALDEIENAHRSVGGAAPGRRYLTQQINHAYAVLLASQFQGFCRDLHTECVEILVAHITPVGIRGALKSEFNWGRRLDRGNPTPGNIASDFERLGVSFWPRVEARDTRNTGRKALLEELNRWRNAIAHQDFDPMVLGSTTTLGLAQVRGWRSACQGLAAAFDVTMGQYLESMIGTIPW